MINSQNINLAICIKVTFISENKLQKKKHIFQKNKTVFSEIYASILSPCWGGNVHTYATTQELKKKAFRLNSQNIKQKFGVQVTFILEIKPQKESLLAKYDCHYGDLCVHFEPLLRWESEYVCPNKN